MIVLDGEQRAALAIVRSLGQHGIATHVGSTMRASIAGGSRFALSETVLPDPLTGSSNFCTAVQRMLEIRNGTVILPVSEASTLAILEHAAQFTNYTVPISDVDHFLQASDKSGVLALAASMGISVPQQWLIPPEGMADAIIPVSQFPVVVKPTRSVTGVDGRRQKRTVSFAASPEELDRLIRLRLPESGPFLIQQRIEGPGLGVFLLRWGGEIIASFAHRRIREKPPSGGVSVCSESIPLPPELFDQAASLLDALDWTGVAMIEFKQDTSSGRNYLMEINPRFWGSLQLAIDSGVDFPWHLLQLALGKRVAPVHQWRVGLRSRWVLGELDHLIARIRRSRTELSLPPDAPGTLRTAASILLPWRPNQRNDVMRLSDPIPAVREAAAWLRAL